MLETKTFRRLGGTREITVDVRLVAATNKDLAAEVEAGRFREDLYYRLSVMPVKVPAVRERSRDDRLARRIRPTTSTELPDGLEVGAESLERLLGYAGPATCARCATCSSGR